MGPRAITGDRAPRSRAERVRRMALLMPATPISFYHEELPDKGIILRFMAAQRGVVKEVMVDIDIIDPSISDLQITMHGRDGARTVENSFDLENGHLDMPINASVLKGTKITVSLSRKGGELITAGQIKGIWMAAQYIPDLKGNIKAIPEQ